MPHAEEAYIVEQGLTLKRAKHEHFKAIEAISHDIYHGFDYLLSLYHEWIDMEIEIPNNIKNFVIADTTGRILGYQCYFFLEQRNSIFVQAMRIDPAFQGKGFGRLFTEMTKQYIRSFLSSQVKPMG